MNEHQQVATTNADVVDRLARLRAVLPLMATDLAVARRRATALEAENARLGRRVRELETRLAQARRPRSKGAPRLGRLPHVVAR